MNTLTQYERVFGHFDSDGDGRISPSELRHCVGAVGGELSEADAAAAVGYIDSDGDGFLGLDDFVKLIEGDEKEEEKVKDLREAFKMYEMDGCGLITPQSLKRMLGKLGESKSVDQCKAIISVFDLNGDGVLNFDEFLAMMS